MRKIYFLTVLLQVVLFIVPLNALIIKSVKYPSKNVEFIIRQSEINYNFYTAEVRKLSGSPSGVICSASLQYSGNVTGWNVLNTWTNPKWDAEETSYYIGKCEGSLGTDLQFQLWHNLVSKFCENKEKICEDIKNFITENTRWVESMIQTHKNESQYWYQVNLVYNQFKGIVRGYNEFKKPTEPALTTKDFLFMNMRGDIYDLMDKFQPKGSPPRKLFIEGHCSAIIKLLPKNQDLLVAHNTWTRYSTMTRILKNYGLNFKKSSESDEIIPGHHISLSSYPGVIHSIDDFYVTSSGLAVQETTIGNSNNNLWKFVTPNGTVFEFVRILVANRLATSGKTWSKIFSQYNSGTYNNQWMIVDYKRFQKGKSPKKGVLWILEQIPGYVKAQDQTLFLRKKTYWPSYNVPFYKDVFKLSGNYELVKKYGEWFSYHGCPRAKIFKRDHKKIKSMSSLMSVMRSNNYKHDPFSKCNCTPPFSASNAIASRHDLNPANGSYPFPALGHRPSGATDAKLVNCNLIRNLSFIAVCGPTTGTDLPPFKWSSSDFGDTQLHLGQPDEWNFQPVLFKPERMLNNNPINFQEMKYNWDLPFIAVSRRTKGGDQPTFKWSASNFEETKLPLEQPDEWNYDPDLFKRDSILNKDPILI